METYKLYWLYGIGAFVILGFIIFFSNISSHNYYQEQYYNHLPSVLDQIEQSKPEAIQHYEEKRDESVAKTEENNLAEKGVQPTNNITITQLFGETNDTIDRFFNFASWIAFLMPIFISFGVGKALPRLLTMFNMYDKTVNALFWVFILGFLLTSGGVVCPIYYIIYTMFNAATIAQVTAP